MNMDTPKYIIINNPVLKAFPYYFILFSICFFVLSVFFDSFIISGIITLIIFIFDFYYSTNHWIFYDDRFELLFPFRNKKITLGLDEMEWFYITDGSVQISHIILFRTLNKKKTFSRRSSSTSIFEQEDMKFIYKWAKNHNINLQGKWKENL
jgi:hypothetical protein